MLAKRTVSPTLSCDHLTCFSLGTFYPIAPFMVRGKPYARLNFCKIGIITSNEAPPQTDEHVRQGWLRRQTEIRTW